jgi:hypothetical protein
MCYVEAKCSSSDPDSNIYGGNSKFTITKSKKIWLAPEYIRGLLEKYPTFGREKETGLLGALDT